MDASALGMEEGGEHAGAEGHQAEKVQPAAKQGGPEIRRAAVDTHCSDSERALPERAASDVRVEEPEVGRVKEEGDAERGQHHSGQNPLGREILARQDDHGQDGDAPAGQGQQSEIEESGRQTAWNSGRRETGRCVRLKLGRLERWGRWFERWGRW